MELPYHRPKASGRRGRAGDPGVNPPLRPLPKEGN